AFTSDSDISLSPIVRVTRPTYPRGLTDVWPAKCQLIRLAHRAVVVSEDREGRLVPLRPGLCELLQLRRRNDRLAAKHPPPARPPQRRSIRIRIRSRGAMPEASVWVTRIPRSHLEISLNTWPKHFIFAVQQKHVAIEN